MALVVIFPSYMFAFVCTCDLIFPCAGVSVPTEKTCALFLYRKAFCFHFNTWLSNVLVLNMCVLPLASSSLSWARLFYRGKTGDI